VELQLDFGKMGLLVEHAAGCRRLVHALIFTAVFSRHMFVWLSFAQTLEAVIRRGHVQGDGVRDDHREDPG
jgi:hypothetical protein